MTVVHPTRIGIDVTEVVGFPGRQSVAGWWFDGSGPPPAVIAVCLHGGTYDKRYWHFTLPGYSGYSMAEHFAAAGIATVAIDALGMGESSRPQLIDDLTVDVAAAAHAEVVHRLRERYPGVPIVGIGHSMGGMLTLIQQASHRSFDRVAILGWSARTLDVHPGPDHFLVDGDYRVINRAAVRPLFHWEDVPEAVIEADDRAVVPTPRTLEDACFVEGITARHAAAVDVPVFVGLGERDVSADPAGEPALYPAAGDVTLRILERSAHCHNFAGTRAQLWDDLVDWSEASR